MKGLTVVVGGPWVVAAGFADHGEAFVTFWEIGEADKEVVGHDLGSIEGACVDQVEHDVVVGFKRLPFAVLLAFEAMSEYVGLEPFAFDL